MKVECKMKYPQKRNAKEMHLEIEVRRLKENKRKVQNNQDNEGEL